MFKNKKLLIVLGIAGGLIIALYIIGRVTGALNFFKVPVTSNIPALYPGDGLVTTNLISPKRLDLITFYYNNPNREGKRETRVFRLCGMPGDTVEIKDGNLYVNGYAVDDSLNLSLLYRIPESSLTTVAERFQLKEDKVRSEGNGKAMVYLTTEQTKELIQLKIPFERYLLGREQPYPGVEEVYKHPWTVDDFGPIQIPKDHYFVLGDNRYLAEDSRYIGFIPKSDLHSVVINTY